MQYGGNLCLRSHWGHILRRIMLSGSIVKLLFLYYAQLLTFICLCTLPHFLMGLDMKFSNEHEHSYFTSLPALSLSLSSSRVSYDISSLPSICFTSMFFSFLYWVSFGLFGMSVNRFLFLEGERWSRLSPDLKFLSHWHVSDTRLKSLCGHAKF